MFYAFVMHAGGDIDEIQRFPTEHEADEFGKDRSAYGELDPQDNLDHWQKYDPSVVLLFETSDPEWMISGKYDRPVAIYHRGNKYACSNTSET